MKQHYLATPLRRALERTIKEARVVAEAGAADAIRRLGIAEGKPPAYLSDHEKELRRRLRAHARTLGDQTDKDSNELEVKRLIEATAYAHWHRILFARFLAERGLLRHPEHDVPVTLEDCREIAQEEGAADVWAVAERYASSMLPAVFHIEDPVLSLTLDAAQNQSLHRLVTELDGDVFQAEDSLGWTYQFWRAAEKDAVNRKGDKIGADEISAVTQLFTEPYMVRFLLHNTLGAWRAGKVLAANVELARTAAHEDELRAACCLPGYSFDMLRFVRVDHDGEARWRPAAGNFPGWPDEAKDITMLDPCCGSGHFLTEALMILAALRRAEEGLCSADAVSAVLRDNLHGLEIDGRCVQIAAFAVALTAWRIGGWRTLPLPQIAWVGAPPPLPKAEFAALANGDMDLRAGLAALHDLFTQAPTLGSLIEPKGGDLGDHWRLGNIEPLLDKLLAKTQRAEPEVSEGAIAARGMADAAAILNRHYTLQATNVPFLGRGRQSRDLAEYISRVYPEAKTDLATAMLARLEKLSSPSGTVAAVTPQNWLFLSSYKKLRERVLNERTIDFIGALGPRAFETISGEVVTVGLIALSASRPVHTHNFVGVDCSAATDAKQKATSLMRSDLRLVRQKHKQSSIDSIISVSDEKEGDLISKYASVLVGVSTSDSPQYIFKFWEWIDKGSTWEYFQTTTRHTQQYGGMTDSILWEREGGRLARFAESVKHLNHNVQNWRRGKPNWKRLGVSVSMMGDLVANLYTGERYDTNCCAIVPLVNSDLPALWAYCSSNEFQRDVRTSNNNMKIEAGTILNSKIDIDRWRSAAANSFPDGVPEPYSDDPTQWLFHGHPAKAERGAALHVALARLSGYHWPGETDVEIRLSAKSRELIGRAAALPVRDRDGLLAVAGVAGEKPLADRLRAYLSAAFEEEWSDALERSLIVEADEVLDKKQAKDGSLEAWLRDRAFRQHCTLFHQRPFIWQIWDGLKDGFSVFVHYHRFTQANLRKLTYTTLGDWLRRAKDEGNDLRFEKGRELQQALEKVLEGEAPYDIFVRWKSLEEQPVGWDPDLGDGVRMNIRPLMEAGILREQPKGIKWTKDRGNDVPSAPWYPVFKGERINDHHTTLQEKRAARAGNPRMAAAK